MKPKITIVPARWAVLRDGKHFAHLDAAATETFIEKALESAEPVEVELPEWPVLWVVLSREICAKLGLSKSFMAREIKYGRLSARHLGRRVFILEEDLLRYLDTNAATPRRTAASVVESEPMPAL